MVLSQGGDSTFGSVLSATIDDASHSHNTLCWPNAFDLFSPAAELTYVAFQHEAERRMPTQLKIS